ncbi:hypothetical protein SO694_00028128 [Aureococcus anophagefferens]|uniref:WW domain-containing protein n=1 Tax=Aureococcus anophagefferens TaxID=44056 RepID=A0ABR1FVE1_AURAN
MADATLPAGWTRHHHRESGVDFYVHEASGETQWQPPADDGLAPGWHAVVDEATGETYYAHAETHETSWAKPRSGWAKVTSGDDVYYAHRGTAETTWERPAGYESPAEDGAIDAAADAPPADAPAPPRGADVGDGWHRVLDPETQEHYYAHRESLVVQWEPPTEGTFSPGMRAAFNGHDGDAADDDAAPPDLPDPAAEALALRRRRWRRGRGAARVARRGGPPRRGPARARAHRGPRRRPLRAAAEPRRVARVAGERLCGIQIFNPTSIGTRTTSRRRRRALAEAAGAAARAGSAAPRPATGAVLDAFARSAAPAAPAAPPAPVRPGRRPLAVGGRASAAAAPPAPAG